MSAIVGRKQEIEELERLYGSNRAEFVAIYGRRRVGKTFLIKQTFKDRFTFQHTGVSPVDQQDEKNRMKTQLESFFYSMLNQGLEGYKQPKTWMEAFFLLTQLLQKLDNGQRMVIFFDELPWMDTPRSGFLSAFEGFWNGWCNGRDNVMLVVCGSATSWMFDKLINNHGGLHNRITRRILLEPFNLHETEQLLTTNGFNFSKYEISECYMVLGGIPYYLSLLKKELTLSQNIDFLLFDTRGDLYSEIDNLYASLFSNSDDYIKVVKALSQNSLGLTRNEILSETGIKTGGTISTILKNLETCGFIRSYRQIGNSLKDLNYQLTDFYTLFYFKFKNGLSIKDRRYWSEIQGTAEFYTWAEFTFEILVLSHIQQIKQKLGILGVISEEFSCRIPAENNENGTQIDLIISRKDNTVNLCEIKFSINEFEISADYEKKLRNRIDLFRKKYLKRTQSLQLTFVTTFGVKKNLHSWVVNNEILLDDLFKDIS
jgi:AAA+ ATPase superfamily predicted ATPase